MEPRRRRRHDVVHLVDDQDDVAQLLDLLDETLHAALKLAAELGARHQGGEIQQVDLLVQQLVGYVPLVDLLGQPLRNGGLAHAGLTDQTGVVLLAAVEDLDGALDLLVPADDAVQLAVSGLLSQGDAVILQKLALGLLFALLVLVSALGAGLLPLRGLGLGALSRAKELVEEGEGGGFASSSSSSSASSADIRPSMPSARRRRTSSHWSGPPDPRH